MKIIIVGGSFAGISCAIEAVKLYPDAQIRVVDKQASAGFIPSGLNLKLNEEIKTLSEAYFLSERDIRTAGVQLHLNTEVLSVDTANKTVEVALPTGVETWEYDKLVLAMGSRQSSKLVDGLSDERIVSTKQFAHAQTAERVIEAAQHIAVIGGGQIGMEACEALVNANKQVTLIEANSTLAARYFDPEFVASIQEAIELTGVELYLGENVTAIETDPLCVTTTQSTIYPDAIILGVNLLPNTGLVTSQVALNADGTILVDDYLETSVADVFAIGDLVQVPYGLTDETRFIALVNNAIRSGQVAAYNLSQKRVQRPTSLRVIGSRVFSQYVVSVGMTEQEAAAQHQVHTVHVESPYTLTDDEPVYLKLVVERESGRLLGGQFRSERNILNFADVLALAVGQQLTDEQLAFQDRLYYPRETSAYPIVYKAAIESFRNRITS
ncbi:MAG: FAD-dependent oxidoreductase [Aerococcaceae bacterium]|nr:FAD-dependent oxidoreductase [Aerococcaceae bacterium]